MQNHTARKQYGFSEAKELVKGIYEEVKGKKPQRTLKDLLLSGDTWEVK